MRTVILSLVVLVLLAASVHAGDADRNLPITLGFRDTDIRTVLANLGEVADMPVSIDDAVTGKVTLQFDDVPALDAMRAAAAAVGCEVVDRKADGILVRPRKAAMPGPRVSFEFADEDVRKVIQALCAYTRANYVLAPDVQGRITLSVDQRPWRDTLDAVLRAVGAHAKLLPGHVLLLERVERGTKDPPVRPITFQFPDEEVRNVILATCGYAQASVVFTDALRGKVGLSVNAVPWPDALDGTLLAAGARRIDLPGGILLVEPGTPTGVASREGATKEVTFRFEDEEIRNVLFAIANFARLNLAVAPDVSGTIDFTADAEPALPCLRRAAEQAGLTVTEHRPGVYVVRTVP